MNWIQTGFQFGVHYVQSLVQCVVSNSGEIIKIGTDLVKCSIDKCFGG